MRSHFRAQAYNQMLIESSVKLSTAEKAGACKMETINRTAPIMLAFLLWAGVPPATASELLFSQNVDNQSTSGPSLVSADAARNSELADDFSVTGNIEHIFASGFVWGIADFQGVRVRF